MRPSGIRGRGHQQASQGTSSSHLLYIGRAACTDSFVRRASGRGGVQWVACLILGVPSALLIPLNWLSFTGWALAVRRGHKGGILSPRRSCAVLPGR